MPDKVARLKPGELSTQSAQPLRALFVVLAGLSFAATLYATPPARGTLAGKVFEKNSDVLVADVTVGAYALTSGEEFQTVTNASGGYFVADAPPGVYAFTLRSGDTDYVVEERLDVRVGMPFLLESCFELDGETRTAHVLSECDSGFVEQARVATIGPHRFLKPYGPGQQQPGQLPADDPALPEPQSPADVVEPAIEQPDLPGDTSEEPGLLMPDTILHDELECLTYEHFPIVDANIAPGAMIEVSRVYFRSDQYPDFYYVDMGPENPTIDDFRAILPKPSPETQRIYYYVESIDKEYDSMQSIEYNPPILELEACRDRGAAMYTGDQPNIVVGATTGLAAALPPGFQAAGITGFVSSLGVLTTVGGAAAVGGGVASTTGLVLVVAGGTAAAAGATVVITGDEASPP